MTDRYDKPPRRAPEPVIHARTTADKARRTREVLVARIVAVTLAVFLLAGVGIATAMILRGHASGPRMATARLGRPAGPPSGRSALASSLAAQAEASAAVSGPPAPAPAGDAAAAAALRYPNPPAVAPNTIGHLHPKHDYIAITLDDGTPFDTRILDLFEQRGWSATTFLIGKMVAANPKIIARLNKDGFEIANHTWDHATLTKLSDAQVRAELSKTQAAISKTTGNQAPYLRPPGGATNARVKAVAASMGYNIVLWNKSFADTSGSATPEQCAANALKNLQPGDIILCHWGRPATYGAMQILLPELARRGYRVVTVSELIADSK
jgi:peptidoglycan/xylan/chitin deacetylase (PgdA/CDA1 family)